VSQLLLSHISARQRGCRRYDGAAGNSVAASFVSPSIRSCARSCVDLRGATPSGSLRLQRSHGSDQVHGVHQPTRVYTLTPDCPGGQPAAPPGRADELNPGAVSAEMRNVVIVVNDARTQNGHIRNDTRDVSRRLSRAEIGPFCRGKCVANDRPCTRLTLSDFHGKEGVDGSSPSEGLPKVPANRHFVVVCSANTRTHSGHICGTRDARRRLASSSDTSVTRLVDTLTREIPRKETTSVATVGEILTPSQRERVSWRSRPTGRPLRAHFRCHRSPANPDLDDPSQPECSPHAPGPSVQIWRSVRTVSGLTGGSISKDRTKTGDPSHDHRTVLEHVPQREHRTEP
jgi:hypothetical protein